MPRKRSTPLDESDGTVRKKMRSVGDGLPETKSIEERAEPFRLMTVRFPIDSTTPEWSTGRNREVSEKHVKQLCHLFEEYGVERRDRAHRIRLLCSARDVRLTCERLGIDCAPNDATASLPYFQSWGDASTGPAEVLAGNHRIAALKAYLKRQKFANEDDERWWVCDIYDRDTLPFGLQIELRANRSGTVLPDTHGHIWTELCTYAEQDKSGKLFTGARREMEAQMGRALRLNTREQFPVRRLGILWKNDRWRKFITRVCSRRAGKDLFNLSIFQKLAGYRIDDHLFERIESIMRPVEMIWEEFGIDLELERDYTRLSGLHQRWKLQELFYPKHDDGLVVEEDSPRHPQFLSHVEKSAYHALYRYLAQNDGELFFPNAHELLRTLNSSGKTMQAVMTHVVMWLNIDVVGMNDRDQNKPPLAEELVPTVAKMQGTAVGTDGRAARAKVLELQRQVLLFVEKNAAGFTKDDLSSFPEASTEAIVYERRFQIEAWRGVMARVQDAVGPGFRNHCVTKFSTEAIRQQPRPATPSLAEAVQNTITEYLEAGDLNVSSTKAKEALRAMLEETVDQWKRAYGQGEDLGESRDREPGTTADISALARFRDVALSRVSSVQEGSPAVGAQGHVPRQRHAKASLFVQSSESKDGDEPPRAPTAHMLSSSADRERLDATGPTATPRHETSSMETDCNEGEQHTGCELSPSQDSTAGKAITAPTGSRPQRNDIQRSESLPKDRTSTVTLRTGRSSKARSKDQQKGGWRNRPFARA